MGVVQVDEFPELDLALVRPIGTVRGRQDVQLMRVGPAEPDGELVFLDEVPATWGVDCKAVPYRQQRSDGVAGAMARWWRVEVQVARDESRVRPGMELVIGRSRAACWAADASFRKADRKGQTERPDPLSVPVPGLEDVIGCLDALDYDYWEKGNYVTAGISVPPSPMSDERRNYSRGVWTLGVCEDVAARREQLRNRESVQNLLRLTTEGSIRYWPTHTVIPERYKNLHLTAQEDAAWLMEVSIRQSLAGPDKRCADWIGKPVAQLVEYIFKGHLYNRNRSLVDDDPDLRDLYQRCRRLNDAYQSRAGRRGRAKKPEE